VGVNNLKIKIITIINQNVNKNGSDDQTTSLGKVI
jgi:hypothetical protein